jgi:rhodanese-related sulfurtransferase
MTPEITVHELAKMLEEGRQVKILDVREDFELEHSRLPTIDAHIPMDQIAQRAGELDHESDWIVVCRTGNRSAKVTDYLLSMGWARVRNLAGGMNTWVREIDPSQQLY